MWAFSKTNILRLGYPSSLHFCSTLLSDPSLKLSSPLFPFLLHSIWNVFFLIKVIQFFSTDLYQMGNNLKCHFKF